MRALAGQAESRRIIINAIAPGFVADTEFFEAGRLL
jgi:NAD(P)-dependent dehydrogenase (short-subunit alcohol dehydrogenase family)